MLRNQKITKAELSPQFRRLYMSKLDQPLLLGRRRHKPDVVMDMNTPEVGAQRVISAFITVLDIVQDCVTKLLTITVRSMLVMRILSSIVDILAGRGLAKNY